MTAHQCVVKPDVDPGDRVCWNNTISSFWLWIQLPMAVPNETGANPDVDGWDREEGDDEDEDEDR